MFEPFEAFREYGWREVTKVPSFVVRTVSQRGAPPSRGSGTNLRWFRIPMADLLKRLVLHAVKRSEGEPKMGDHRLYRGIWEARARLYVSESGIGDLRKGEGMDQLERVFRDLHEDDLKNYQEWLEIQNAEVHASLAVDPKDANSVYLRLHAAPAKAIRKK